MSSDTKSSLDNLWFVGVALATFASFVSNLGLNLQKLLHLQNQGKSDEVRDSYYKFGLWWIGVLLLAVGAISDIAALTFAPQSLVAPLGSLTLVSNIILSPIILKEVITTWDVLSTLTIVLGCVISVIFASHEDVVYANDELFRFFLRWPFLIYMMGVIIFMAMCYVSMKHYEGIEHDPLRYSTHEESWHRLTYPALSGTIGAQSVLFAKCFVEMVVNAFDKRGSMFLARWQAYFIIIALVTCVVLQVKWLNDGLRRFDAAFEVPVFQAFWVVLSVGSGLIFYNEYLGMNLLQKFLFAFGVAITVTGVIMLSRARKMQRTSYVHLSRSDGSALQDADDDEDGLAPGHKSKQSKSVYYATDDEGLSDDNEPEAQLLSDPTILTLQSDELDDDDFIPPQASQPAKPTAAVVVSNAAPSPTDSRPRSRGKAPSKN